MAFGHSLIAFRGGMVHSNAHVARGQRPEPAMHRRTFLTTGAAALTASMLRAAAGKPPIIDTHLHCFAGENDARFPYHKDAPYRPKDPATPEQLLAAMDEGGVTGAVVVHPEPYQDDHRYLEYCLAKSPRLKGTALLFADRSDTPTKLRELAKTLPIVAVRIHAYSPQRLPPFDKPEALRSLWKAAGESGLAVQLHFEPRYAPPFEPYIREFKDVRVLIDHLGRPFQGTPMEHERVVGWSKYPNVIMKLSSVPAREQYPHRDPAAVVKQLTSAFGAERLMHGGGFKAPGGYKSERDRVSAYLGQLNDAEREKIFGGTAARVFGFKT
jgi:predicted TIM-barrel fold metal-dependent hydrolase